MKTCYDCIHCEACSDAGDSGFSCLKEDVSKCKHFKNKADFVEVRHGEWKLEWSIIGNCLYYHCSICGAFEPHFLATDKKYSNYCPNCGAKMDGERK